VLILSTLSRTKKTQMKIMLISILADSETDPKTNGHL
jgi:hypothetical protein